MPSPCLVKEPYNSRTFKSSNAFLRKPAGNDRNVLQESKKNAWERHRETWGTAIYEQPLKGATHKDMIGLRNIMKSAKLPPCSLKGHRHYGAAAEPITLLEGNVEVAEKGAAQHFRELVERDVMGNSLHSTFDELQNSAATRQRALNHNWNDYGAIMQLHTQACLEYATSLQVNTGKSTMGSDYVEHKTAYLYQPLPAGGTNSDHIRTPFAKETQKQQERYSALIKTYYKELYSKQPLTNEAQTKPSKPPRTKTANSKTRCRSTTPTPETKAVQPTKRSRSAMLRAVSEATSTSEVSCSLAILPATNYEISKTREEKVTAKITDVIANRQMDLKRSDLQLKFNVTVPPVQYFLSDTRATQTDTGMSEGLNPLWPPSNKSDNPDKIGYPHLRLPLAIDTLIRPTYDHVAANKNSTDKGTQISGKVVHFLDSTPSPPHSPSKEQISYKLPQIVGQKMSSCVKSEAHAAYNNQHQSDWVPRIWDYNYLLFHLDRRGQRPNGDNMTSCHASHVDGLIG